MGNYQFATNLDSTYPDDPADPTKKLHQQAHDGFGGFANNFDSGLGSASVGDVLGWNGLGYAPLAVRNNVRSFGAVGDGTTRTVNDATYGIIGSGKMFADLTAARTGTGISDLALTDQLDWAAHQWAVNDLTGTGAKVGGFVYTPAGRYMHNRTLTFPAGSHPNYAVGEIQVNWIGDGVKSTIKMTADLGSGQYAVTVGDRGTNGGTAKKGFALWRGIRLIGPSETDVALGTSPCNMRGFGFGAERHGEHLWAQNFYAGFDIVGDHSTVSNLRAYRCYYGMYFGYTANLFGDWTIIDFNAENCYKAGLAVHGDTNANNGFYFIKGGVFATPYGIYKETGTQTRVFGNSTFYQFMIENVGNGAIGDEAYAAGGNPTGRYVNTYFNQCVFDWDSSKKIAAEPAAALFNIGKTEGVFFTNFRDFDKLTPGTLSLFNIVEFFGLYIEADVDELAQVCTAASKPVFARYANQWAHTAEFHNVRGGTTGYVGRGILCETAGAVGGRGYGVKWSGANVTGMTAAAGVFAGVSLEAAAGASVLICVLIEGDYVPVVTDAATSTGRYAAASSTEPGKFIGNTALPAGNAMLGYLRATGASTTGRMVLGGLETRPLA